MINSSNLKQVLEINNQLLDSVTNAIEVLKMENSLFISKPLQAIKYYMNIETEIILMPVKSLDTFGGSLIHKNGRFYTFINTSTPKLYENLTWAHEFYHYRYEKNLIMENQNKTLYDDAIANKYERKAYLFATELLIDNNMLHKELLLIQKASENGDLKINIFELIFKLMETFEVPYKAIILKLAQYNYIKLESAQKLISIDYKTIIPKDFDKSLLNPSMAIKFDNINDNSLNTIEFKSKSTEDQREYLTRKYKEILSQIQKDAI